MRFSTVVVGKGIQNRHISPPWATMYLIAAKLQDEIINRTQAGSDAKGSRFTAYSRRYVQYKKGMMAENGGFVQSPELVTLTNTGRMINSIQIKRDGNYIVLYFSIPERAKIGYYHQTGAGHLPKREWLTINLRQRKMALERLQAAINGALHE